MFGALFLVLATLDACVSDRDSPALYVGMSRERLKTRFGEPLRVEPTRLGGEDWYYSFVSWRTLEIDASASNEGPASSGSFSVTISDQNSPQECPVHLSPDGYVVEPLPVGKIVGK